MKYPVAVVLLNVRSTYNVGSIFRTADGAGVQEIMLIGYTPSPVDRYGAINKQLHKTALGAEQTVQWKKMSSWRACATLLRKKGYALVAVEQSRSSIPYTSFKLKKPTAFIFGNEVRGISSHVVRDADAILELPMRGKKESLNVAVAAGVLLYSL